MQAIAFCRQQQPWGPCPFPATMIDTMQLEGAQHPIKHPHDAAPSASAAAASAAAATAVVAATASVITSNLARSLPRTSTSWLSLETKAQYLGCGYVSFNACNPLSTCGANRPRGHPSAVQCIALWANIGSSY